MRVYSHSYLLIIFVQPIAVACWRGRGRKLSRILEKKHTIFNEHPVQKFISFHIEHFIMKLILKHTKINKVFVPVFRLARLDADQFPVHLLGLHLEVAGLAGQKPRQNIRYGGNN